MRVRNARDRRLSAREQIRNRSSGEPRYPIERARVLGNIAKGRRSRQCRRRSRTDNRGNRSKYRRSTDARLRAAERVKKQLAPVVASATVPISQRVSKSLAFAKDLRGASRCNTNLRPARVLQDRFVVFATRMIFEELVDDRNGVDQRVVLFTRQAGLPLRKC